LSLLHKHLEKLRTVIQSQPTRTEQQKKWTQRLLDTERLVVDAIALRESLSGSPDDEQLKRKVIIREGQAKLALAQVWKGTKTHRENYDAAHGATPEEKRAGWNAAYRQRIRDSEGREVRPYQKRKDMTEDELRQRDEHRREKARLKKQKQRAKNKPPKTIDANGIGEDGYFHNYY